MSAQSGITKEIERKYLLSKLPPRLLEPDVHKYEIEHGWLPGKVIQERISYNTRNGGEYWRVVKSGKGLERIEAQELIYPEFFKKLWNLTNRRVSKTRYDLEGWEVDNFSDRVLFLAEIELPSVETRVVIPDWLQPYVVREVTEDPNYLNVNLARTL